MALMAIAGAVSTGLSAYSQITGDDPLSGGARTDDQRAIDAISGQKHCPGRYDPTDIRRRMDKLPLSDQRNFRQSIMGTTSWLEGLLDTNQKAANAAVYRANGGGNCVVNTEGERKCSQILDQIISMSNQIDVGSAVLPPPANTPYPPTPSAYGTNPTNPAGHYEVFTGGGGSVSQNVAPEVQGGILSTLEGALAGIQQTVSNIAQGAASGAEQAAQAASHATSPTPKGMDTSTLLLVGAGVAVALIAFR